MKRTRAPINFLAAAAAALALVAFGGGCAGYRVGSMLPKNIKTVYVPTFENKTDEPLIEGQVTSAVISQIQRDGSLKVVSREQADSILKVCLNRFILTPIGYSKASQSQPNEYRIVLSASYVLTDARTGKVLSEHARAEGESLAPVLGDLSSSKRAALPEASRTLALDIVNKLVETWM